LTCPARVLGHGLDFKGLSPGELKGERAVDISLRPVSRIFANRSRAAAVAFLAVAICVGLASLKAFLVPSPVPSFVARGPGYSLMLTSGQALIAVASAASLENGDAEASGAPTLVRMDLMGAAAAADGIGLEPLPGRSNYFIGSDRERWLTGVPQFGRVRYQAVYPGIDLEYYGAEGQLEYDFIVAPGADPTQIRLRLEGGKELRLDPEGNLLLGVDTGDLLMKAPVIYQVIEDRRQPVEGRYVLHEDGQIGFEVGIYQEEEPLVIDPVLVFLRYLGGTSSDYAHAVAVDPAGYIYVAGMTFSVNFPTSGGVQEELDGTLDAFVTRLTPGGTSIAYSTYLGGSGQDLANGIAVDPRGVAFVAGETQSSDFPTQNAYQDDFGGVADGFISRLWIDGSVLQYSTYLGGWNNDIFTGVAADREGNAYLVGRTYSSDFPTRNAYEPSLVGGAAYDAVVVKVNFGGGLDYSTYLGGASYDYGEAIALDSSNNAYVTGWTMSTDFPTVGAVQQDKAGAIPTKTDAFVSKLNASGSALTYSTYLGGGDNDKGMGIAVDSGNNTYVTGSTNSSAFPTVNAIQPIQRGESGGGDGSDAFITKLNAAGTALIYSTFLGGTLPDIGQSIAVDDFGSAYVAGETQSTNFPTSRPVQGTPPAKDNAFVSGLSPTGSSFVYSTYLGGSEDDTANGIAWSSDFPSPNIMYGTVNEIDAFIVQLSTPLNFWLAAAEEGEVQATSPATPRHYPLNSQ